jgi:hypothetical protein
LFPSKLVVEQRFVPTFPLITGGMRPPPRRMAAASGAEIRNPTTRKTAAALFKIDEPAMKFSRLRSARALGQDFCLYRSL